MKRILLSVTVLYVLLMALRWRLGYDPDPLDHIPITQSLITQVTGEVSAWIPAADSCQIRIKIQEIHYQDINIENDMGLVCYMDSPPAYQIGDIVSVQGTFSVPQQPTNPGQFNTYIYQKSRGIDWVSYAPQITCIVPLNKRNISYPTFLWILCRQQLAGFGQRCIRQLSELEQGATEGVLPAMLFGDKSGLSSQVRQSYQDSGIAHVLAISALHVGLVSGVLYGLLRWFGISYYVSGVIGITITFAYGYMTGAQDASMRAAIMLLIVMMGAMIGRTSDILTSMGISMAVLVTIRVYKLQDAGFLLSFGSVLGIGYVYPLLQGVVRIRKKCLDGMLVTLSVWLVTMPVMLYFYGTFTPYAILLNLVVIPLMTPVLICGLGGVAAGLFYGAMPGNVTFLSWVAHGMTDIAVLCVKMITGLGRLSGVLPGSCVILGAMEKWKMVLYYTMLLCFCGLLWLIPRGKKPVRRMAVLTGAMMMIGMIFLCGWRTAQDRVTMLDVGQGDSILLSTKQGAYVLVDGGSTSQKDVGQYVVQPALTYYGIRSLDYVVITHADADHVNGITYLMEQGDEHGTRIGCLVLPWCAREYDAYQELISLAAQKQIQVRYVKTGDAIDVEGLSLQCLSPDTGAIPKDINDQSVVLLAQYPDFRMLLTGDISSDTEQQLVQCKGMQDGAVDVLKVAHHGSGYSSSQDFLQWMLPRIALISCGRQNRYGHPHAEALSRLHAAGARIYRTDMQGAVTIRSRKGSIRVYSYIADH